MAKQRLQFLAKLLPGWVLLSIVEPLVAILVISRTVQWGDLQTNAIGIFFFFALYTGAEVLYVPLPRGGGVSVGLAVILAYAAIYGPGIAALISGLGMVTALLFESAEHVSLARYTSNFGQIALSAFAAGWVFRVLRGSLDASHLLQNGLLLCVASAAFFAVNVTLVLAFLSSFNQQPFKALWPDVKHTLTSYFALVPLGILVALIFKNYGITGSVLFFAPLLLARYSFLRYLSTRNAGMTVGQAFAAALEAKDSYTKGHSDRVAGYAEQVARQLDLPEEIVELVKFAAALHDIGKIGISEYLLNKPDVLDDDELDEIRRHALIGADMLDKVDFLEGMSDIIRYHHEWFDGSRGYPHRRAGEEIPLGARILTVCDAYDAMTSDRPYRKGLGKEAAIEEIRKGKGRQFDPRIVDAFLRVLATGYDPTHERKSHVASRGVG